MRMFRPSSDTSNEGDSWSGEDASGEQPVNPIIELGSTDFRGNGQKIKRSYKSKISKSPPCLVHRWIHQNRMRVFGIALVLVGVFVVSATFLFSSGVGEKDNPNANLESDPTSWVQRPGKNDQGSLSNTPPLPSFNVESPTQTPVRKPSHNSVFDRLSLVVDPSLLTDPETPQGKAYRWIDSIDDLRWSPNHPSLLQRFSLATFYFSTGGQRTTATWEVCSAVPSNILNEGRNAFSTRCVFDDNRFICAAIEDFLECPEYYERYNLVAPPVNPKKRWLSSASECDWYGVFCNERGNVEQLTLPKNGLEGALVSELEILNDLIHINLGGNKLTGALPEWGALASGMQHLSLDGNSFVGSIPYSAPHWANLKTLDLARNRFTGTLKLPGNWLQMETLILSDNQLDLTMSSSVSLWSDMQTLDLSGNSINGGLPGTIGSLKSLIQLNVANCQITGEIPPEIGGIDTLSEFDPRYYVYLFIFL